MNIFRFIADMLHVGAILVLLYRIKKSRNCIGKISSLIPRTFMQDSGDVLDCLLHQVHGPLHVLHLAVQHFNENLLHFFDCLHHLPHEIQETVFFSK